jgi:predicted DNA-binding transcriptional regulator AlpA
MPNSPETLTKSSRHRLINRKQLKQLIPISTMTIWRWERDGRLPQHITIGRTSFWRMTDVLAAIEPSK